jgi:uncharacterized RDD family membrane protein YckC
MVDDKTQIDSTIQIVTPENIAFRYRVAGPFRRFPAFLIDLAIRGVLIGILATLGRFLSIAVGELSTAFLLVATFVIGWFYGGLFETYMNGQTPGKRLLGLRVLSTDGQPINGLQATVRNILRDVDVGPLLTAQIFGLPAIPLFPTFIIGLVVMTTNRRFQRLGDLACRTIVVIEETSRFSGVALIEDPRAFQLASYLPADLQAGPSLLRALAHYAERRKYFSQSRRREVAGHLAAPLLRRFGMPSDTSYDLLLCAMYYRLFIADRGDDEQHAARAKAGHQIQQGTPQSPFMTDVEVIRSVYESSRRT